MEGQLENMGFDVSVVKQEVSKFKDNVYSYILFVGHVPMKGLPNVIAKISRSLQSKEEQEYKDFKQGIKDCLSTYIEVQLLCAHSQISIQLQRQDQLINTISQQKKLMD